MKPERVLQLGMTDNLGGIETYLINYYRNIDRSKIQFDFINIYKNPLCFSDEILSLGGRIYNISNYYKHPIKYIKQLISIINNNSYNIIHCNMNSAVMIYPLIAAKLSNAKIIISHSHNSSSDKGIIKSILHSINKNFIPLLANKFFACSDKAGEWFFSKKIIKSSNYKIIYNAIDIDLYKYKEESRIDIRKELKISKDKIVIGHIGRFNKQKNHKFLIKVFYELHKINKNFILILVGQGPLAEEIKLMVKEKDIRDSVIFLGQRLDTNKIYNAMDLFLLPSLYEGLPLVGVEAQINGLKCIFSDSITKELSITEENIYLPLENKLWKDKIINYDINRNFKRIDYNKFDIRYNANILVKIYLEGIINYGKK